MLGGCLCAATGLPGIMWRRFAVRALLRFAVFFEALPPCFLMAACTSEIAEIYISAACEMMRFGGATKISTGETKKRKEHTDTLHRRTDVYKHMRTFVQAMGLSSSFSNIFLVSFPPNPGHASQGSNCEERIDAVSRDGDMK